MTRIFTVGAGAKISFAPSLGDLPIYDATVRATGFTPWRELTDITLLEISAVSWPANPHATITLLDGITKT
jgi:hypothetical protein